MPLASSILCSFFSFESCAPLRTLVPTHLLHRTARAPGQENNKEQVLEYLYGILGVSVQAGEGGGGSSGEEEGGGRHGKEKAAEEAAANRKTNEKQVPERPGKRLPPSSCHHLSSTSKKTGRWYFPEASPEHSLPHLKKTQRRSERRCKFSASVSSLGLVGKTKGGWHPSAGLFGLPRPRPTLVRSISKMEAPTAEVDPQETPLAGGTAAICDESFGEGRLPAATQPDRLRGGGVAILRATTCPGGWVLPSRSR